MATKPIVDEAKPLEFYVINYELDGGTLKGNYPTAYNSLISEPIVLPTPTKLNCEFLGWSLNGDYVTEIPSTSRGDIVLVAEWKVLEGEIYDVTYIFNGGYSEEYLVAHSGNAPHLTIIIIIIIMVHSGVEDIRMISLLEQVVMILQQLFLIVFI